MSNTNNGRDRGRARPAQGQRPKSRFHYQERSVEALKARAERQSSRFDSIYKAGHEAWRPKQGESLIRFLPPTWPNAEHYGLTVWVHGFIGPDRGSYLCLAKMQGKPCPICRAADEAKRAGDEEEQRQNTAQERVLAWILDRDGDEPHRPLLFQMSWTQDRDIVSLCRNRRTGEPIWIDQPDVGYDLSFQRTGTGMKQTRYFGYQIAREASPVAEDMRVQDGILQFIEDNPLPSVLQYYPADYLAKALLGTTHAVPDDGAGEALLARTSRDDPYEEGVSYEAGEEETGEPLPPEDDEAPWEAEPPEPEPERQLERRSFRDRVQPPQERMTMRPPEGRPPRR
jgi:hypothetical protein